MDTADFAEFAAATFGSLMSRFLIKEIVDCLMRSAKDGTDIQPLENEIAQRRRSCVELRLPAGKGGSNKLIYLGGAYLHGVNDGPDSRSTEDCSARWRGPSRLDQSRHRAISIGEAALLALSDVRLSKLPQPQWWGVPC